MLTSSTPQKLPVKQEDLFRDVLMLLEKKAIPIAVSGAFALQEHCGVWRNAKDLDIFLPAENTATALGCLLQHGFECDGVTTAGIPLHNVAITLLQAQNPPRVYRIFDL